MFEHLDSHDPVDATPSARDKVSAHVKRRTRRRRQRWALTGIAVLVVAAAVGVPLGLGAAHQKHPTALVTTDRGTAPPSTLVAPTTTVAPTVTADRPSSSGVRGMRSVEGVALAPDGQAWAIGLDGQARYVLDHSTDGGATWQQVPVPQLAHLAPTSSDPRLRAAAGGRLWVLSSLGGSILAMTLDGGSHWSAAPSAPGHIVDLQAISSSVWALTDPCPASSPSCTKVLLTSDDGGLTWSTPAAQPVTGSMTDHALPPGPALTRLDAEHAWVFTSTSSPPSGSAAGRQTGNVVLSRTNDGGRTWHSEGPITTNGTLPVGMSDGHSFDCEVTALAAASSSTLWLLCGGQGAVARSVRALLRSTDGGATWAVVPEGAVEGGGMPSIAASGRSVLVTASAGPVDWSADAGRTWTQVPEDAGVLGVRVLVRCVGDGRCLIASVPRGSRSPRVWRTTDGGATWSQPVMLP